VILRMLLTDLRRLSNARDFAILNSGEGKPLITVDYTRFERDFKKENLNVPYFYQNCRCNKRV